jgi:pimeloyl-ACP methyl ester carboxylesterase
MSKAYRRAAGALTSAALRVTAVVAPRYLERQVAHRFLTPRRSPRADRVALPAPDHTVRVCVDGIWIAAWRWGEGPAVMLVHGWEDDHRCFAAMIAAFVARGQAVVTFDLPAHGRSDGEIAILPTIARAIDKIGQVLGPIRALAGHSFGGAAVTYAVANGVAVERAAILAAPVSLARALDFVSRELRLSPERAAGVRAELHRRTGVTIESLELEPIAAKLTIPALIIHSRDDRVVQPRAGERLAAAWAGAELLLVDGLGHRRILSDAALIDRVLAFLGAPQNSPALVASG